MTEALLALPVTALLDATVRHYPQSRAIDFMGRVTRYGELDAQVSRAAKGLQELGVKPGTRVGLCLPNTPYAVIFFFAVLRLGGIVVNYNPLYVERELAHLIRDSGTEIMVTIDLAAVLGKVQLAASRCGVRQIVVCAFADALPPGAALLFRVLRRKLIARVGADAMMMPAERLMGNDGAFRPVEVTPADIAVLQYTGGTTGVPKAAMLTHGNLTSNSAQSITALGSRPHGVDRVLGVLPLFHVFAMMSVMLISVHTASEMILLPRYDVRHLLKTIARTRPTMLPAVPTIYAALVEEARRRRIRFESIQMCVSGGAPLSPETRRRFMELTGCWLVEGYGLSEASPVVSITPPGMPYKDGSVGLPLEGCRVEIRALDDPTRAVPAGERGEVCVRGPQVMRGYWHRPEETEQVLRDGLLRTGDVGYLDSDGYLFLVDRIKDVIIASGYNVYPRVIEDALYEHPQVKDAVVIGVPDEYRGQAPKAFVTLRAGARLGLEELRAHLAERISKIEMPREIEIRAELPKTLIGKLSRKELREEEAEQIVKESAPP